ncbi:MAG TPA: diguanylate cyclase [bacterium]|nr:diguanylate cyclase [bacterium]HMZ04987.1 diguanylate cyclase [bacterium]HNB10177.1 diguanylate cyclase [bacterium]HND78441.1 diguanylate cyclase [bacterium]HNE83924.1 diguanylate cyclase [bacterium]
MSRTYKILIVDDNPDHVYSLRKTLQRPEYVFFEAHSGEDALGSVTAHDPDIMLLDVRLPGIDGFEICESIRKISAHLPIVFVTANLKEFVDQVHGFEKGGDDYVIQPYDPRELAIKVKALLRNKVLYDSLLQEVNKLDRMKAELQQHNEELKKVNNKLEEKTEHLKSLTVTDPLTALFNRKYFHQRINKEISAVKRYKAEASAAMVDIVNYTGINEQYGVPQADVILKEMASLLVNSVRNSDIVTRFDGGKFAVIFTHTPEDSALIKARMIVEAVAAYPFPIYDDLIPQEKINELDKKEIRIRAKISLTGLNHDWVRTEADLIEAFERSLLQNRSNQDYVFFARK